MIENSLKILKERFGSTDLLVETVGNLYQARSEDELERFVSKAFKTTSSNAPHLWVTQTSANELDVNVPPEVASFLYYIRSRATYAIEDGFKAEGELLLSESKRLSSFFRIKSAKEITRAEVDKFVSLEKDKIGLVRELRKFIDNNRSEVDALLDTISTGCTDRTTMAWCAAVRKEMKKQEAQQQSRQIERKKELFLRRTEYNLPSLVTSSGDRRCYFTSVVQARITYIMKHFGVSHEELFTMLDYELRPDGYSLEACEHDQGKITQLLEPFNVASFSFDELYRYMQPVNPVIFSSCLASMEIHSGCRALLQGYVSGTLEAGEMEAELLGGDSLDSEVLIAEKAYLEIAAAIGEEYVLRYGKFRQAEPGLQHRYWGAWLAVNPQYQIGGEHTKLGWRNALKYGEDFNAAIHQNILRCDERLSEATSELNRALLVPKNQDEDLPEQLLSAWDRADMLRKRAETIYAWSPHEIIANFHSELFTNLNPQFNHGLGRNLSHEFGHALTQMIMRNNK
jgi:hypothetical protein